MRTIVMAFIGVFSAFMLASLGARGATRHGQRAAAAQPRAARMDDLSRQAIAPVQYARANSLWGETSIAPCMIGTVWGERPAQASFAPQMRLSMKAPLKAAASGGDWFARAHAQIRAEIGAVSEADIASRYVAMEPGAAPVVRVLRIADFRPRKGAARPARTYGTLRRAA